LKRRVLVTGATGFVGQHCLVPLVELGFEVHAVARRSSEVEGVTWHRADLLAQSERRQVLELVGATDLLHLAWYLEPGKYMNSPSNLEWAATSIDLVKRFHELGGTRVVGAGSCFEYDWSRSRLSEVTPLLPRTLYGQGKRLVFEALTAWEKQGGPQLAWGRIFFLYGPGEDSRRLIGDIARSLLLGREVPTSRGLVRRDYMYVKDAARAMASLLHSKLTGPVNIATGTAIPVHELVRTFADRIGRPELVRFGLRPGSEGEPECIEADVRRLHRDLGWNHLTPLADAVDQTVRWWEQSLGARTLWDL
jgi:nucleoside-diphosphate-sugar epimerase